MRQTDKTDTYLFGDFATIWPLQGSMNSRGRGSQYTFFLDYQKIYYLPFIDITAVSPFRYRCTISMAVLLIKDFVPESDTHEEFIW